MTIPQWALLAFSIWTVLVLLATVGVYRWSNILTGRTDIAEWQADLPQGSEWYRRAIRAHANCLENLPVFAAIVYCATVAGARGSLMDVLAVLVLVARLCQTTVHLSLVQTNAVVSVRFAFFLVQVLSMLGMAAMVIAAASPL